jgi:dTDP-4-amino-4,6-dideoxygalactose transaminase
VYIRLRLDISWRDLLAAAAALVTAADADDRQRRVEALAAPGGGVLCCLSVRSALDLYLDAVGLPAGGEVLMTAVNVPDVARIVERHGLIPIPVDVDPATLGPSPEAIDRAASSRTVAVLVAHLFGSRAPLDAVAEIAGRRGWRLLEDCAQCFSGCGELGDPRSDAAFFSFGPIKTATALAGGLVRVRDAAVLARMRATQAHWPLQRRRAHGARILKFAAFKLLSWPPLYGALVRLLRALGRDPDTFVQGSARAFPRADLYAQIRRRPSAPLLALL